MPTKVRLVKAIVSSSHVWMWELDHKEIWAPKNWCFWTVVLEKTLESPLDYKGIKPVNCKGNQPWISTGRTEAEAETPILWPPDGKNWLTGKDPNAGKDWKQEEKGTTRGWDGWRASLTRWTWVWASSRSWWWTGKPGELQSMGQQSWTWLSDWTDQTMMSYHTGYQWAIKQASLVDQMIKNVPSTWETWVQSLGWEDLLEKGMATHSSILAWRIPMDRGAWWATVHGVSKSQTQVSDWAHTSSHEMTQRNRTCIFY